MDPIYDWRGDPVAFLTGMRIVSRTGESLAWIDGGGNVYAYDGRHIGWWEHRHLRAHDGGVIGWVRGASGLGLSPPQPRRAPPAPHPKPEPHRHDRAPAPPRPPAGSGWSETRLAPDAVQPSSNSRSRAGSHNRAPSRVSDASTASA